MKAIDTDIVRGGVLVTFSNRMAVLFDPEFLYDHRKDRNNKELPIGDVEDTA